MYGRGFGGFGGGGFRPFGGGYVTPVMGFVGRPGKLLKSVFNINDVAE